MKIDPLESIILGFIVELNHGCVDVQELLVALIAVGVKVWRNPARGESFPPSRLTRSVGRVIHIIYV